ncbi:E3 ubiquitin-protein ligase SHPRH [Cryptosporidium felis]|nr:E3 ubiquitin-protein ligase SHPRH [Cryptosporidium felis]
MVREKPPSKRYGGHHLEPETFCGISSRDDFLESGARRIFEETKDDPSEEDSPDSFGFEKVHKKLNLRRDDDLVGRVNTWKNVRLRTRLKGQTDTDLNEVFQIEGLGEEHRVIFRTLSDKTSPAKCEIVLLDDVISKRPSYLQEEESSFKRETIQQESKVIAVGQVSYSSLRPRVPYSEIRRSLVLLQDGGFITFTAKVKSLKLAKKVTQSEDFGASTERIDTCNAKSPEILLTLDIYLYLNRESLDSKLLSRTRDGKTCLKIILSWLYEEYRLPNVDSSKNTKRKSCERGQRIVQIRPHELYSVFQEYNLPLKRLGSSCWKHQVSGIKSCLRSYQKDAVMFALEIEKNGSQISLDFPPYWCRIKLDYEEDSEDGSDYWEKSPADKDETQDFLFANIISGEISRTLPPGGGVFTVKGGFLCDEMGLGKSLEIIALILLNPKTETCIGFKEDTHPDSICDPENAGEGDFECPCGMKQDLDLRVEKCRICGVGFHYCCCIGEDPGLNRLEERPVRGYCCSICQNSQSSETIYAKTTLIIAPGSIVDQWHDEFEKHLEKGVLKIGRYDGVRSIQNQLKKEIFGLAGREKRGPLKIQPSRGIKYRGDIQKYDVILTSYEVLKEEIYHVLDQESVLNKRSLRFKKTYPILACFLTNINWWRIVLDEAQMTEGFSLVSKMTSKLNCNFKWCVTGTPVVRSCSNDFIGLLANLSNVGFSPITDSLYKRYIGLLSSSIVADEDCGYFGSGSKRTKGSSGAGPFETDPEPDTHSVHLSEEKSHFGMEYITTEFASIRNLVDHLERTVGSLFYRREMSQVKDEVNIPETVYGNTLLDLSSVERFFYIKQCETGYNNIQSLVAKVNENLGAPINRKELDSVITMLRLACVHPQLGSMGLHNTGSKSLKEHNVPGRQEDTVSTLSSNSGLKIMTMDQILDKLLNKCRIDIEETVRKYVMNTLGLAGIYFYKKDLEKAAFYYKQVLDIRNEDRVDVLQQIHTMWNLCLVVREDNPESSVSDNQNKNPIPDSGSDLKSKAGSSLYDYSELARECSSLEDEYRRKHFKDFKDKFESLARIREKTGKLNCKGKWWHAFGGLSDQNSSNANQLHLVDRIWNFLYEFRSSKDGETGHQLPDFTSIGGLLVILDLRVQQLEESRETLVENIDRLKLLGACETLNDSESSGNVSLLDEMIAKVSCCSICQQEGKEEQLCEGKKKPNQPRSRGSICFFCSIQTHFESLEFCLYTIKRKGHSKSSSSYLSLSSKAEPDADSTEDALRPPQDTTYLRDSEVVAVMKFLSKELRKVFKVNNSEDRDGETERVEKLEGNLLRDSIAHIKHLESLKIELAATKMVVSAARQLVNSYLELIDCKQRIKVTEDPNITSNHTSIVHSSEIPFLIDKYELERISALGTRRHFKSQQKFLCNLKLEQRLSRMAELENGNELEDEQGLSVGQERKQNQNQSQNLQVCPVCLGGTENEYSRVLLPCAHILCVGCYKLIRKSGSSRTKSQCPSCRSAFCDTNVVLVVPEENNLTGSGSQEKQGGEGPKSAVVKTDFKVDYESEIQSQGIVGNFGTKIEAIIKHIKWIIEGGNEKEASQPDKIIVFSDFQQALDVISSALSLNQIPFKKYNGGKSEFSVIREFSSRENNHCKVLVCNHLNVGKGVNITAANHIIFVSPLLNKSDELQAIGRIIRMGQTKTPHIWNFVINDSVDLLVSQYLADFFSTHANCPENPSNLTSLHLKIIKHISETNFTAPNGGS